MKQERSQSKLGAPRTKEKRLLLLGMLVAAAIALSGCYMEPPDLTEGDNALTLGTGGQQFEAVITATPEANLATATPTPAPTDSTSQVNWDDWVFDGSNATDPPVGATDGLSTQSPGSTASGLVTPTPTPGSGTSASSDTLRDGSSGSAVSQLQTRLKELGYYSGSVDGKYGGGTTSAVKAFQSANNLTADGIAGKATQEAVYSPSAVRASTSGGSATTKPTSKPTSKPNTGTTAKPTATPNISGRTDIYLKVGDSGAQVKILQNRLIALGYLSGTADSKFQATTEAAVIAFQKRNSVYDDGIAGPTTLSKLYSSSAKKASTVAAPLGSLKLGMNGSSVRALQQELKSQGFYTGSVDGDYGAGTEAAVTAFQSANGLTTDGVAGAETLNAIFGSNSGTSGGGGGGGGGGGANSPVSYGVSASTNGLKTISASSGNSTSDITALQSVLQSRNYYNGTLDGSYGSGTTEAVSSYQKAVGLRVTGMAGPSTQRLLYGGTSESGTYKKLDMGSTGSAVRNLQYTLYELMYYDGNITGTYDDATRNAVLLFQQVNGLTVDGVAGEATQRRLYSSNAIPCNI